MSIFEKLIKDSAISSSELRNFIYGSEELYQNCLKWIAQFKEIYSEDQAFAIYEMSRIDKIKFSYFFLSKMIKSARLKLNSENAPTYFSELLNFEFASSVSIVMVQPVIEILGTKSQIKKWIPGLQSAYYIGAYCQTELGHGSDVQSIETEAIFDLDSKEFIINSPTTSSMKWWPGELSSIGNLAVVYAKTYVHKRKVGVFPFIVQIRDFETHQILPGIELGDIGAKFGWDAKENGFLRFTNLRIPLDNMLGRYVKIDQKGKVIQKGNPKIIYSAMLNVRKILLSRSSFALGKGVAIAIRYSNLRKQFKNENKEEIPIIQYQLQQQKLFTLLAKSYAMQAATIKIQELIQETNLQVRQNDFKNLQEIHIMLSGTKAFFTWWCLSGLKICMESCGGHGYNKYSGIVHQIESVLPNIILEGENTVMCLQVGKFLLKTMKYILEGRNEKVSGYCSYLKNDAKILSFNSDFSADLSKTENMKNILQKAVFVGLSSIIQQMTELSNIFSFSEIFNKKSGIAVFNCAKLHVVLFTVDYFCQVTKEIKHETTRKSFENLSQLFGIDLILEMSDAFAANDLVSQDQIKQLKNRLIELLDLIRVDAFVLADVFVPDDFVLFSALAKSNEAPYQNLYNTAKNVALLNKTDLTCAYLDTIRKASVETYPKL